LSGIALSVGGSAAYSVVGPALGAAAGAVGGYGECTNNKTASEMAIVAVVGGSGGLIGDAVGHGLTALTGQPAFQMLGAATGALTGSTLALDAQNRISKYAAPVTAGVSGGTVAGTLLGAGLTALTGHSAYQLAGTVIGATAGVFAGLAAGAGAGV
jgi:hypothetical protein